MITSGDEGRSNTGAGDSDLQTIEEAQDLFIAQQREYSQYFVTNVNGK